MTQFLFGVLVVAVLSVFSTFLSPVFAGPVWQWHVEQPVPAQPYLVSPAGEKAVLSGNKDLEFKWLNNYRDIRGFVFRIYKGYNMYAGTLLLRKKLESRADSLKIKSEFFENGRVYTWSLEAISFYGDTGDLSFDSFKIIKKP